MNIQGYTYSNSNNNKNNVLLPFWFLISILIVYYITKIVTHYAHSGKCTTMISISN